MGSQSLTGSKENLLTKQETNYMNINTYQENAKKTAIYPKDRAIEYVTLGLVGEAGELANKAKKIIRDNDETKKEEMKGELGDVLWYVALLATELNVNLNDVAQSNLDKLQSRQKRKTLNGSGDQR